LRLERIGERTSSCQLRDDRLGPRGASRDERLGGRDRFGFGRQWEIRLGRTGGSVESLGEARRRRLGDSGPPRDVRGGDRRRLRLGDPPPSNAPAPGGATAACAARAVRRAETRISARMTTPHANAIQRGAAKLLATSTAAMPATI
jgi:hypothetical protein